MSLGTILIIGIAAYLIYNIEQSKRSIDDSPLDILKKRYARGEITFEEFEQIKQDLE